MLSVEMSRLDRTNRDGMAWDPPRGGEGNELGFMYIDFRSCDADTDAAIDIGLSSTSVTLETKPHIRQHPSTAC
jgi:hypothetical protein